MNKTVIHETSPANDPDNDLRQAMKTAVPPIDPSAYAELQSRVLAQWRERDDALQLATRGPVIGLHAGLSRRRLARIFVASLLLVLVAISILQSAPESAHDELMEPDVLSLISLGEL